MRVQPAEFSTCAHCGSGSPFTLEGKPIRVLGVNSPSNVDVGICTECGGISHFPSESLLFIRDTLKKAGVLDKLFDGDKQIVKEANYYLKKQTRR